MTGPWPPALKSRKKPDKAASDVVAPKRVSDRSYERTCASLGGCMAAPDETICIYCGKRVEA